MVGLVASQLPRSTRSYIILSLSRPIFIIGEAVFFLMTISISEAGRAYSRAVSGVVRISSAWNGEGCAVDTKFLNLDRGRLCIPAKRGAEGMKGLL